MVVQGENRVVRAFQNVPVALFAGLQFLLGNLRFGDVPAHRHGPEGAVFLVLHEGEREVHRERLSVLTPSCGLPREGQILNHRISHALCLLDIGNELSEVVRFRVVAHVQPEFHGERVVVLIQDAVGIEGDDHVDRRLDDGSVEPLGVGQTGLGLFVPFNFLLEQLVGFLGKRRTHLLTHQSHACPKV